MTKKTKTDKLNGKAVAIIESGPPTPVSQPDQLETLRLQLIEAAEAMSEQAIKRLRDPKCIKKMDIDMLLTHCEKIMAALSKPSTNVFMPKGFAMNMQQVNNYSNDIANSPTRKQQLRNEARRQLKNFPT